MGLIEGESRRGRSCGPSESKANEKKKRSLSCNNAPISTAPLEIKPIHIVSSSSKKRDSLERYFLSTKLNSTLTPNPDSSKTNSTLTPNPDSTKLNSTLTPNPDLSKTNSTPNPESSKTNSTLTPNPESSKTNSTPNPDSSKTNSTPEPNSIKTNSTLTVNPDSIKTNSTPKPNSIKTNSTPKPTKSNSTPSPTQISVEMVDEKPKRKNGQRKPTNTNTIINGTIITDHFVRRSSRITTSEKEKQYLEELINCVSSFKQDGLEICDTANKGRGIISMQEFTIGDFICEYAGELIPYEEAKIREADYAANNTSSSTGSYMYFFVFEGKRYCVDATPESKRLGRLINHSRINNNIYPRVYSILGTPKVIFFAKRNIEVGEELLYDYGDRSKKSIADNPWLLL